MPGLFRSFNHPFVLAGLVGGVVALAAFLWVEQRSLAPMLPLDLFRSSTFSGANLLTFLLYAAISGALFFLPFNLIQVHGYTPTQSGAALLPLTGLLSLFSGWSGRLVDRYGPRLPLIAGPLVAAAGYALMALPGTTGAYWTTFFLPLAVLGLGMAITVAPLTTTVLSGAAAGRSGIASGVNNAVSRTASLLAIAVFGICAYWRFGNALTSRLESLGVPPEVRRVLGEEGLKLAAAMIPAATPPELRDAVRSAIAGSFVDAFRLLALLAAGLAVASSLVAWMFIGERTTSRRSA